MALGTQFMKGLLHKKNIHGFKTASLNVRGLRDNEKTKIGF